MSEIKMEGVREYYEEMSVELGIMKGRIIIKAFNECGYNGTGVDLEDLLDWINKNKSKIDKLIRELDGEDKPRDTALYAALRR